MGRVDAGGAQGRRPAARSAARAARPSTDPPDWKGDADLAGRLEEVVEPGRRLRLFRTRGSDPSPGAHLFRADITELVLTGLNDAGDMLVIEHWHEGRGVQRVERS